MIELPACASTGAAHRVSCALRVARNHPFRALLFLMLVAFAGSSAFADSDPFPAYEAAPALTTYVSDGVFRHSYYIAPDGSDTSGDGSIGNPWASLTGATTGGAGVPVAAGDAIYFRGGTYPAVPNVSGSVAASHLNRLGPPDYTRVDVHGIATDRIVLTAYPGEIPVFEGADGAASFSIHGDYVVVDGLTFTTGGILFRDAAHSVVQNCTFGEGSDVVGDQIHGMSINFSRNSSHATVRNNFFDASLDSHAIKVYMCENVTSSVVIEYNRFLGRSVPFGTISFKAAVSDWEIAYNRFEDSHEAVVFGTTSPTFTGASAHTGVRIHHNAFDNVYTAAVARGDGNQFEVWGLEFHDNVVLNATSGDRYVLALAEHYYGAPNGTAPMGTAWNNALYDFADAIYPGVGGPPDPIVNSPDYWNYNAYPSAAARGTAENRNGLVAALWDGASVIQAAHGITRTGLAGDRFYTVADDSPLRGAGRYGDSIGGFTWGGDTLAPAAPTNLTVQ